jgi:AcrR family transcriptional regulator
MARKYELKKRAERQAQTRQRIVEAAVELHGTVGPAQTTISAIAERAGVERKTFYRHFPNPDEIFTACAAHFRAHHPPPDPEPWLAIDDPQARLRRGLHDCYRYYRRHSQLLENVLRDRRLGLPVGEGFLRHRAAAKHVLAAGFARDARRRRRLDAALELALDFHTWQTLAQAGLNDAQATELTSALVAAALPPPR